MSNTQRDTDHEPRDGATENARHENKGRSKMQGWKMRDMNLRHHIAGVENAGKVSMESQSVEELVSRLRSSPLYSNIIRGYF